MFLPVLYYVILAMPIARFNAACTVLPSLFGKDLMSAEFA
jgi:hypothetical protein